MAPYQVYGLYLHPVDKVPVTLQADEEKLRYYGNKGFVYLGPMNPPGITAGPRDIDRDDSGIPKGPDGSTHDRHPGEVTPDNVPVPWGFPLMGVTVPESTPRTRGAVEAAGLRSGVRNSGESDLRKKLRDADIKAEEQDRIVEMLRTGGLADPQHELRKLHQQATLPGELVETGVTRGMSGVDLTMPPVVSGATSSYDKDEAARRGEIEVREVEVAPGEVVMQQFAVHPAPVPQAPGDPAVGTPTVEQVKSGQKASADAAEKLPHNAEPKSRPTAGPSKPNR